MKVKFFAVLLLVILAASCGGTTGGTGDDGQRNDQPITLDISSSGGVLELLGIAKVEFPEGAVESSMSVSIQENAVTDGIIQLYTNAFETNSAGQPYKKLLIILIPDQPKKMR